jgi:sec-independent protein translocase protein TatA
MPFGLGLPEVLVIGVVALVIFGPKKLPEMGSSLGKAIKNFKSGFSEEAQTPTPAEPPQPQSPTAPTATQSGKDA